MVDPLPCVLPVGYRDALQWCEGEKDDLDLFLHAPLSPECIFIVNLPNLRAYAAVLKQCLHWYHQGAVCLITRTFNATVDDHILKNGGLPTYREKFRYKDTQYRFLLPPRAFKAFFASLDGRTERGNRAD